MTEIISLEGMEAMDKATDALHDILWKRASNGADGQRRGYIAPEDVEWALETMMEDLEEYGP